MVREGHRGEKENLSKREEDGVIVQGGFRVVASTHYYAYLLTEAPMILRVGSSLLVI